MKAIKEQNPLFKSSLRCMICVLAHAAFYTCAEIAIFIVCYWIFFVVGGVGLCFGLFVVFFFNDCTKNKCGFVFLTRSCESVKGTG